MSCVLQIGAPFFGGGIILSYRALVFIVVLANLSFFGCKLNKSASVVKTDNVAACESIKTQISSLEKRLAEIPSTQNQNCSSQGGTVNDKGVCLCKDGTPLFKIGNKTCDQHMAASGAVGGAVAGATGGLIAGSAAGPSGGAGGGVVAGGNTGLSLTEKSEKNSLAPMPLAPSPDDATGGFSLSDNDAESLQKQLNEAKLSLENCQRQANQGANAGCASRGGTTKAGDETCRCANGTPVFKIGSKTCAEYLGATPPNCAEKGGIQVSGDTTCRCPDGTPIFKIGTAENCAAFATQQTPKCTDKGGSIKSGEEICRCPDGTPVFKIGSKTCADYGGMANAGGVENCKTNDQDCDGIVDGNDFCSGTAKKAKVWEVGSWSGCTEGQFRDNAQVGPMPEGYLCDRDKDCDGVTDAEDQCSQSPYGGNAHFFGEWKGCVQGECRDRDRKLGAC